MVDRNRADGWAIGLEYWDMATLPGGIPLGRWMLLAYQLRDDLRLAFSLSDPAGRLGFLYWCLTAGRREFPSIERDLADPTLRAALHEPAQLPQASGLPLSNLLYALWLGREDLQNVFPLSTEAGGRGLVEWFLGHGMFELELLDFLTPEQLSLLREPESDVPSADNGLPLRRIHRLVWQGRPDLQEAFALDTASGLRGFVRWIYLHGVHELKLMPALGTEEIAKLASEVAGRQLTHPMLWVWESRPDLQEAFDLSTPEDVVAYRNWIEAIGSQEYPGVSPQAWIAEPALADSPSVRDAPVSAWAGSPSVALLGYPEGIFGIGEDLRMSAAAFASQGRGVAILDVEHDLGRGVASLADRPVVKILHLTPSDTLTLLLREQSEVFNTGYVIAYWPWELEHWPPELAMALDLVDELWVSTEFVRRTLELVSPVPVVHMPMAVSLPAVQRASRSDFGLTEEAFLFLMVFDGHSTISRKNPLAGVQAFRAAFPTGHEPVSLIIKTMNVETDEPRWREVLSAAGGDPRVVVYNEKFSREALVGLFQLCDCFVSPHRSEGYGRAIAEALLLNKPVIATAYGGNMDFTNHETAYLVDFVMTPIRPGEFPFAKGAHWAEPSVDSVARQMRAVAVDREGREATARRGAALIRRNHDVKTVGARYMQRIDWIVRRAGSSMVASVSDAADLYH